jgi:hypothetical protein
MATSKEVHLFDAADFNSEWTASQLNQRYSSHFVGLEDRRLLGEATPIYLFWPEIIPQLSVYNSELKLIVLLRDPVERAISHYKMEFARGNESCPLWLALLLEPWRLALDQSRAPLAARRCHSYISRGHYSNQLMNLRRHFPDRQILLIENAALVHKHRQTLLQVYEFLCIEAGELPVQEEIFAGNYVKNNHKVARWLLGGWYRFANRGLKHLLSDMGYSPNWSWLR